MNGLAWDQLLLIIGLIVAGVALVVVRRPLFAFWISAVEDWLPRYNPHSPLAPSPLYIGMLGALLIILGVLTAIAHAAPGFTPFG
ncbi:hypothetical protein [Salinibacterium sp. SWN167]|uniref:hypothetical protein n=1 Tax=Salinibacterium sp. SWN167 TaxID=2792054 RepID=UPI0018CF950F|nr:hypothetical protein [Salinibacterium sp. SWN167]MBH0082109.1 hypothetical protein [Salinibacterium sp. SWN167]